MVYKLIKHKTFCRTALALPSLQRIYKQKTFKGNIVRNKRECIKITYFGEANLEKMARGASTTRGNLYGLEKFDNLN